MKSTKIAQRIVLVVVAIATLVIGGLEVVKAQTEIVAHYCDSNKKYCGGGAGIPTIHSYY
jgi:hypothetical protein